MKTYIVALCAGISMVSCFASDPKAAKKAKIAQVQKAMAAQDAQQKEAQRIADHQAARMLHHAQMSHRPVVGSTPPNVSHGMESALSKHNRNY